MKQSARLEYSICEEFGKVVFWNQNGTVMANITLKNIPEEVYKQLKERAKNSQRSINSEIIRAIQNHIVRAERPDPDEIIRKAREFRSKIKVLLNPEEIEQAINEGRP